MEAGTTVTRSSKWILITSTVSTSCNDLIDGPELPHSLRKTMGKNVTDSCYAYVTQ